MTTATIEGMEIVQLWGNRQAFIERVTEYATREGAEFGFVITLKSNEIALSE